MTCTATVVKVMGKIKVVTDSAADVPSELAQRLDITILPCYVIFGSEVYRDGVDLTPREFYDKLATSRILPTTSQPPLGLFVETYQNLLQESEGIVSIHIASTLSGVFNAARVAADALSATPIVVIDSQQLSMGAGWQVIMAAQAAQEGHTLAEVVSLVQAIQPRARAAAMLDSLEHIGRSGRISRVTDLMGTALRVKPLLQIATGEVTIATVRTRGKALRRLAELMAAQGAFKELCVAHADAADAAQEVVERLSTAAQGAFKELCVAHADAADAAQEVVERLSTVHPRERLLICQAGAAVTTHLGLGAVGICGVLA
jgi:DegV family protein with EDD domain